MYISHDGQKLYLKHFEYTAARVFNALEKIIMDNGGRVDVRGHYALIVDRSVNERKSELNARVDALKNAINSAIPVSAEITLKRQEILAGYINQLNALPADVAPITARHLTYIRFVLNDVYYYYQINDNPFYNPCYIKTPVANNSYSGDACIEEMQPDWYFEDVCFGCNYVVDCDIIEIGNLIFNALMNVPHSKIRPECKRVKVANIYDNGMHYERVYISRNRRNIDF